MDDSKIRNRVNKDYSCAKREEFVKEISVESPNVSISGSEKCNKSTKNKKIILCLDGTENGFNVLPDTNVLKLFKMLEKNDSNQICYYQPGIGIDFMDSSRLYDFRLFNSIASRIMSKVDAMIAFTLEQHVLAAYKFLMQFYNHGDKIFIIGFRGSFAGRVLAGMIERVGLLNKGLEDMTNTAWRLYCDWEDAGQPAHNNDTLSLVAEFKNTFSIKEVVIHFMGLWDSVNSVGMLRDRLFPYTIRSTVVKHVRHAVSIDERRSKYKQVLFQPYSYYPLFFHRRCRGKDDEADSNKSFSSVTLLLQNFQKSNSYTSFSTIINKLLSRKSKKRLSNLPSEDIIELFFSGNHGDCGGGWPPDSSSQNLSDIPFRWILLQALKFGITFQPGSLSEFNHEHPVCASLFSFHHDILSLKSHDNSGFCKRIPKPKKKKLTYQEILEEIEVAPRNKREDVVKDSMKFGPCQLDRSKCAFGGRGNEPLIYTIIWWLMELLPAGYKIEDEDGKWKRIYVPNFGRPRKLPKNAKFHWSVFYRLHFISNYYPKNLPNNLGQKFTDLISESIELFEGVSFKEFTQDLTIEKIKNDWNTNIWSIIPDDLQIYLQSNPYL